MQAGPLLPRDPNIPPPQIGGEVPKEVTVEVSKKGFLTIRKEGGEDRSFQLGKVTARGVDGKTFIFKEGKILSPDQQDALKELFTKLCNEKKINFEGKDGKIGWREKIRKLFTTTKINVNLDKITAEIGGKTQEIVGGIDASKVTNAFRTRVQKSPKQHIASVIPPPQARAVAKAAASVINQQAPALEDQIENHPAPIHGKGKDVSKKGEEISYTYTVTDPTGREETLGTSVIKRSAALDTTEKFCDNMIKQLQGKIDALNDKIKGLSNGKEKNKLRDEINILNRDLKFYETQKRNIETHKQAYAADPDAQHLRGNWIHSNYFRDSIEQSGFENAREGYIACPVNMRSQTLNGSDGQPQVSYGRVGVISDMRNGFVSYKDLERIKKDSSYADKILSKMKKKIKKPESKYKKLETEIAKLELEYEGLKIEEQRIREKFTQIDDPVKKQSLSEKDMKNKEKMKANENEREEKTKKLAEANVFVSLNSSRKDLQSFAIFSRNNLKEPLKAMMRDREIVLEQQMMVYLQDRIGQNLDYVKECIEQGKPVDICHVGLLSEKTKMDNGWQCNERVQMEDMAAIFEKFRDKNLIFDGTGPRIDGNDVYFSFEVEAQVDGKAKNSALLNPHFFNTSVQGQRKNNSTQGNINRDNLKNARHLFRDENVLSVKLEDIKGSTDYDLATDLAHHLRTKTGIVSVGCVSAKDRAGIVGERLMEKPLLEKAKLSAQAFFTKVWNDKDNSIKKVIEDNLKGHTAIRATPNMGLYRILEIKSFMKFTAESAKRWVNKKFFKGKEIPV